MKNSKYIILTSLLALFAFSIITYTSCKSDKCKSLECRNGSTCSDGTCACPTGYTGELCEIPPDFCDLNQCLNGGTCSGSICNCPAGYEGVTCENETRDKFINGYVCLDKITGDVVTFQYTAVIEAGTQLTQVKINNFGNGQFTQPVMGTVNGNILTVLPQFPDGNGKSIQATGTFYTDGNSIAWIYQIITPTGDTTDYEGVWGQ